MPIFMDRHDIPEEITAEHVAKMHQEDLKIEHLFGCKGMTYWCDEKRKTAFCLIEAPNKEAIQEMHNYAHGDFPHRIIEVDTTIVESFLGRIEDPEKSKNTKLNIINDPAFRTLLTVKLQMENLADPSADHLKVAMKNAMLQLIDLANMYKGSIVRTKQNHFLASFESVTNAVSCALECQKKFNETLRASDLKLNIGLCAGVPVTEKPGLFEDTIKLSNYLCDIVPEACTTSEIKDLYESEHRNGELEPTIKVLDSNTEFFLRSLMDILEKEWRNAALDVQQLCKALGLSKTQANRKIKSLTHKSPKRFVQEIRLQKSLSVLKSKSSTISEIAYDCGFASPTYYSRVFKKRFGISPTDYLLTLA